MSGRETWAVTKPTGRPRGRPRLDVHKPPRQIGRVERSLDRCFAEEPDVPPAVRSGLRVLAHGLDIAERKGDAEVIATCGRAYFAALELNKLTVPLDVETADVFAELLDELNKPTDGAGADAGDETHT